MKSLDISLRVLQLNSLKTDASIVHHLLCGEEYLKHNDPKVTLTTLDIVNVALSHEDCNAISQLLKSNSSLKHLRLGMLHETYSEELRATLSENNVLQTLSFSGWSDPAITLLYGGLQSNNTLQHLSLGTRYFTDDELVQVTNLMKYSPSLITINMRNVNFRDTALKYLRDALRQTKNLEYIGLPTLDPYGDMAKGIRDAISKREIKVLHDETDHSLMFPDSPKGFHKEYNHISLYG